MAENEVSTELLTLLKALADKNRLKIIGLLAQRSRAVEDISTALKVSASTVSHHLSVLSNAGLVVGRVQGYYSIYSLQSKPLEGMAKSLLRRDKLTGLAEESVNDPFDKKVLAAFTTMDGRIRAFPTQEKKFLVLVRYVLKNFESGVRYTEKQVNAILGKYSEDTALLRRAFIEYRFMTREGGGRKYWRID
jgi:hypothetical protein